MTTRAGWRPPIPGLSPEVHRTLRRLVWRYGAYAVARHVRALAKLDGLPATKQEPQEPRGRGRPKGAKDSTPRARKVMP